MVDKRKFCTAAMLFYILQNLTLTKFNFLHIMHHLRTLSEAVILALTTLSSYILYDVIYECGKLKSMVFGWPLTARRTCQIS